MDAPPQNFMDEMLLFLVVIVLGAPLIGFCVNIVSALMPINIENSLLSKVR